MTLTKFSTLILTTLGAMAASQSAAQSLPAPGQSETGWRHVAGIYMFAPVRTWGTSTVGGISAQVDMDLSEILDVLDFAASGQYEAWNGNYGIILEANYAGIEETGPTGALTVNVRQKWAGLLGAYRVAHGMGGNGQPFAIDIQGGARWNSVKQTLTVAGPLVLGGDEAWIEPVVGMRGMWRLNDRWTTIASANLGGFGAGGNDLQVGLNIGFDYQPWDNTSLTFGYRYFSVDYSTTLPGGTFAYDMEQHGPYVGVKFFF